METEIQMKIENEIKHKLCSKIDLKTSNIPLNNKKYNIFDDHHEYLESQYFLEEINVSDLSNNKIKIDLLNGVNIMLCGSYS